jgi:cell division inhibitor SulA
VKIKIFMALLISALVLSACNSNGNQEDQKTDDYGSGNVAITNDANTEKNTYTEANKDNTEETTITLTDSNDTTGDAPLIKPAYAEKNADEMTDNELIKLLQNELLPNSRIFQNLICNGDHLERDFTTTYDSGDNRANYVLIKNFSNKKALESCINDVFTDEYLVNTIYPILYDSELPLFIEVDGRLYNNAETGGGIDYNPDFSRATVMSKTPDSFEVEVPITHMVDPEGLYIYKVVKQKGNWLLDCDYWLDLHYIYFSKK